MDSSKFEKAGLKIDKDRVLTYSGISCPLDCKYCFSDELKSGQKQEAMYLSQDQLKLLGQLPEQISLIMLGCDTELFLNKKDAISILERVSTLNKNISVVTKLNLSEDLLRIIKNIDLNMREEGHFITLSFSIPCIESSIIWEPRAPSPQARIKTLESASYIGLETLVAIRPLIPNLSNNELIKVVELTSRICRGYYSGPLYLKNLDESLLGDDKTDFKIERVQPHWMPDGNIFYRIQKPSQMKFLTDLIISRGLKIFEGAAEAINFLRKNEKH